jgi:hypothetical protein
MSDLDTETNADVATFEKFGRTWSVPTKKHHEHIRRTKAILRSEGGLDADDIAEIYLSPEQYADLVALNVDFDRLSEFADEIAKALGTGDSGNSEPSSASS